MATTFTSNTLSNTYYDDFSEDKNFHQILFNSGRALQARELTQLQTLIYQEMGRFGRNVFKEGAAVNFDTAGMEVDAAYEYVQIASTNEGGAFDDIPVGTVFRNASTGLEARVIQVSPISTTTGHTLDTLYIQYTATNNATPTATPARFGDAVSLSDQSGGGYELVTHTPNASGRGCRFSIGEGDFFVLGRFVHAQAQTILLNNTGETFSGNVGFKVTQEVVTVNDDDSLYDNTGNIVNRAAPGADRYRITLTLVKESDVTSSDTFMFLARIENSTIVEVIQENDAYNQINELLALRTEEESGDYVVSPFIINYQDETANDSSLELIVSNGVAYVNGHRAENQSPVKLTVPRPQTTELVPNDVVPIQYGNYVIVNGGRGLPPLDLAEVNLSASATDPSSAPDLLGTCRVRAIEEDGSNWKCYIFDISLNAGKDFANAKSIGTGTSDFLRIRQVNGKTVLEGTTNNDLLMPTSRPRSESLSDITLTVQKHVNDTSNGSGEVTLTLGAGESFVDGSLVVASDPAAGFITSPSLDIGTGVVSGLNNSTVHDIYYYVQKTGAVRSKTLSAFQTATLTKQTDAAGYDYYDFGVPDVYQLDSVREDDASGLDVITKVQLDDGQRDNFYADSRLIVSGNDSAPEAVYVKYKHFTRGAGDFFAPSSYNVGYSDIPTHTLQDGTEVRLINYLDFRPDKNDGTFTGSGSGTNVNPLPRNETNLTADINYYLPRADKLLITEEGDIQLLMGQQAAEPQFKDTPDNSLELYKIVMNANTLDEEDLTITPVDNRVYTMRDIGDIESKLDDLEQFTRQKFIDLESRLDASLDSDGNERPASGVLIDGCFDQTNTDVNNDDHRAALDPQDRLIRPMVDENNIRLIFDNASSNNVTKVGDNVYLSYTEETWQEQGLASSFVNPNPFGTVDNVGTLKLSPSSDEWRDVQERANRAVQAQNKLAVQQALLFNNWQWNWGGGNLPGLNPKQYGVLGQVTANLRKKLAAEGTLDNVLNSGQPVNRVVASETIRTVVNGRVIDVALIPWMRSRKVYFHAKGLKPNTKFTPFFDGVNVSSWCREEASFVQWSDRTEDIGNQYRAQVTTHPDGSSDLTSDANGEIIGSFFIPNQRPIRRYRNGNNGYYYDYTGLVRFRSGVREFKLLDINRNDWNDAGSKCFAYYSAIGQVDRAWAGFWNLRGWQYVTPWNYNWWNAAYTPQELKAALDATTADAVGFVDPQLSGQYGPVTPALSGAALAGLDASGEMSQVLSDYVNVNGNQFAGTNANPLSFPQNPLAQTFHVDNQFGLVLTKVQLYFRQKDSGNLPISVHIRPVSGGKPSHTTIVPDSHVYLNPDQVTAIGISPQLSTILAAPTDFVFDEPIYLQPHMSYAIVVTTQSTEYEIFTAKVGQTVFGSTSRSVTTQAAPGELFLPQNGFTWVGSKSQDLTYILTRAKFATGGGSAILQNADLPASLLDNSPIKTTAGSGLVYVRHMNHGLQVGDGALLDSCEAVNGITANQLNNTAFTVDSADLFGYSVTTAGTATSSGFGGGEKVLSQRNAVFSTMVPTIDVAIPKNTSIDASAKLHTGRYISGSATRFVQDAQYRRITLNENVHYDLPRAIYNANEQDNGATMGSRYSALIKLDLKSSNDYVSPVINLQRASLLLAGSTMNDPSVTSTIAGSGTATDTSPYGSETGFNHILSPVTLQEDAVGIDARCSVNLPEGSNISFYWRTCGADENIYDFPWTEETLLNPIAPDNSPNFQEAQFLVGGRQGTMESFNQVQGKFVLTAKDREPAITNLRLKYLVV